MELLPICNVTYTNKSAACEVSFLKDIVDTVTEYVESSHIYFVDLCYCCNVSILQPLLRCSGCQLVAYCSKDCQKTNWNSHKNVCKEFPLVKGKNVLYTKGIWKKHIAGLRKRAARLPHADEVARAKSIFHNPRVCRTCREARPDHLTIDCSCACVSYCNKRCAKADKRHKEDCNNLQHIALSYVNSYQQDMPYDNLMLDEIVIEQFNPVYNWCDIFPPRYNQILQILLKTDDNHTDTALKSGLAIEINPLKGFGSNRAELDSNVPINNEKSYFTCLRRK